MNALEAAAEALPDEDSRRARVLALLAVELVFAREPERCRTLATEAIQIARAAGDPVALAHTLLNGTFSIWGPDTRLERQRLLDELGELAQRLDDPRLSFLAAGKGVELGIQAGDRTRVESGVAAMRTLAASVPEPSLTWVRLLFEAGWALVVGDLQASEQRALEAFEAATASGQPDGVLNFGGQLFNVRRSQGRLGELAERSVQLADTQENRSAWRAAAALTLIESGREDEARELVRADDLQNIPWDPIWPAATFFWTEACVRVSALDCAGELYALLEPVAGQVAVAGVDPYGSFDWALGTLARALERYEQAENHFAAAAQIEERLGAPLFLARTRTAWARTLIARGHPEDLERAEQMLEQADEVAGRLGAQGLTREVSECRSARAAISG